MRRLVIQALLVALFAGGASRARAEPDEGERMGTPVGFAVETWDRVQAGADVSDRRWQFMGGLRVGALFGRRTSRAGFLGVGPSLGLRTTRFSTVSGSGGITSLFALDSGYEARLELEYGRTTDGLGPFVAATVELGMGTAFNRHARYAHRVEGGLALTYIVHTRSDERQIFLGFSVQTFVALIAPLFIRP